MSSTLRAGSYRAVLLLPSALRTFVPALAGRLAYGLLSLSTLFTVHDATGSFAVAGAATAGFGLASLSMPYKARLVDRYSQRRVLPPLALVCALGLVATTFLSAPALLVILVTAAGVGTAYLCVAGFAQAEGKPGAAGFVEAGIGLGSVVGGLLWGRRKHTRSHETHLAGLIGLLAAGLLAASLASHLVVLGLAMGLAGVAVAPLFVVSYLAADELTPPDQRTEASTWINTANNLGSSAGASLTGVLIDRAGPSHGFLAGGVLLVLVSATLLSRRRK